VTLVNGILLLVKREKTRLARVFSSKFFQHRFTSPEITMISVRLPDGSAREFDGPVTVAKWRPALDRPGKAALAGKVDGKWWIPRT
jgi:hypothetical protein